MVLGEGCTGGDERVRFGVERGQVFAHCWLASRSAFETRCQYGWRASASWAVLWTIELEATLTDLVSDRLSARIVLLFRIDKGPATFLARVRIPHSLSGSLERLDIGVESVSCKVLCGPGGVGQGLDGGLLHAVERSVDVRVQAHREKMLVIVRVDARCHLGAETGGLLALAEHVEVQDSGKLDFQLDVSVLEGSQNV